MKLKQFTTNTLVLLIVLFITSIGFTQETDEEKTEGRKEKVEQLKIAYFTKELDLTSEEAEKFWPVYNEMSKKIQDENKSRKVMVKDLKENIETLTEEDIKTKTNSVLDSDIAVAQLKKEYNEKIADIIGYKKATKLLSLEAQFKRELLNTLNERPQNPGGPRPQHGKPGPKMRTNR